MNAALVERQLALGAVALLAALASIALGRAADAGNPSPTPRAVAQPPPIAGRWYEAPVGPYGPGLFGQTTDCGVRLTRETRGVAHPVLPCGARIVVEHRGRQAETRVVDTGSFGTGQEFALTEALARDLDLRGIEIVRWRFSEGR